MDILIVEPLEPKVVAWLEARHDTRLAPELAADPVAFRAALADARAVVVPASVPLDGATLRAAPRLRAIGRVSDGLEQIDREVCKSAGIQVVRAVDATAAAEAEFVVAALLLQLRRVPVPNEEGLLVGRELGACTVGLVGLAPSARPLATLLSGFGARVIGYDPSVHASDERWAALNIQPASLMEVMSESDGLCVLLNYYNRYRGLLSDRVLSLCKKDQVMVCLSHSALFDEPALAQVLRSGRMAAAWLDAVDPDRLTTGGALRGLSKLQTSPRISGTTRESRSRAAWTVARRIDEVLTQPFRPSTFRQTAPGGLPALEDVPDLR